MAGYIYCMQNDHKRYKKFVMIGYTARSSEIRRVELCEEFHCKFEILWDIDVYEPARAEKFLHEVLNKCRFEYGFFDIDPGVAKQEVDKFFDEHWREIEGKEIEPLNLVELARLDAEGFLVDPEPEH